MRVAGMILIFIFLWDFSDAQLPETPFNTATEQQLESITENNEDTETEDDLFLQELAAYRDHPLDLNSADEKELAAFKLLDPIRIANLLSYRNMLGKLIDIYELQAIPGWDISVIQKIRPYVTVGNDLSLKETIYSRLKNGQHNLLFRISQTLERSRGYLKEQNNEPVYEGSPQKLFVRYKYNYKNLLQYGITGEKDAGEQFFKGKQKTGFDFYSMHFFLKNAGIIKSLALGDLTVNFGQGLVQWMGLAFKKSADITAIKRQGQVLKPYNSAGETNFHRGAGITIAKNNWEASLFGSYKKIDANFNLPDSSNGEGYVSSFQTSGLHRSLNESADKKIQSQLTFGGNFSYQLKKMHIGFNAVQYKFGLPLIRENEPYNQYAFNGNKLGNYSIDYSYTYKNMHFFGESAVSDKHSTAFLHGLLLSVANNADMSFVYRRISKSYQSFYTSAFAENSTVTNENGLFTGISIRPSAIWRIDAYADIFSFPWLKYNIDAPVQGCEYMIQCTWKPGRALEIYSRYRSESKPENNNFEELVLKPLKIQTKQNWRTQLAFKIDQAFTIRARTEICWFSKQSDQPENGFLIYADLLYKPLMKPFSANMRLQYFETDGYDSRVYAYENDILYNYSIPVFYGKGYRYYLNVSYDLTKKTAMWLKFSQSLYPAILTIGSGYDEIADNHRTDVKIQLFYKF